VATIEGHAAQVGVALEGRTAINRRVLAVMLRLPPHAFVPAEETAYAYEDRPLPSLGSRDSRGSLSLRERHVDLAVTIPPRVRQRRT
jgi:protein-L-isoaspartate O-methyltransferase